MAEAKTKIQEVGERIKELLDETICILRRKPIKPYDAEIEYLECTGTQYIDTLLDCYNTDKAEVGVTATFTVTSGNEACILGTWISNYWFPIMFNPYNSSRPSLNGGPYQYFGGDKAELHIGYTKNNRYDIVSEYNSSSTKITCTLNNETTTSATSTGINPLHSTKSLLLMSGRSSNGLYYPAKGKLHYCRIYKNNSILLDLIPVRVGTVGYLYDKVSGELFGNAGTGSFVLGPDIVPIEYLESTGTQYVDTGIMPQDTTRIDCVYECIGTPPSDWWAVWGCEIYSGGWKNFHLRWQPTASATHIHLRAGTSSVALGNEINVKNNTSLFWKSELSKGVHNGVEHAMTYSSVSMISYSIYLFAQHDSSGATKKGKCRIYKLNIYGEDGLTRSFVPVRVGQVGYLLDKVSNKLYGNSGTGSFVLGPDTVPVIL